MSILVRCSHARFTFIFFTDILIENLVLYIFNNAVDSKSFKQHQYNIVILLMKTIQHLYVPTTYTCYIFIYSLAYAFIQIKIYTNDIRYFFQVKKKY